MKTIEYQHYEDRVLAAWLGKSIGGVVGANVENHKERKTLTEAELWPPEIPPNDDLDIQLVWLEALQERGCYLTADDLAAYWQDRCWYNFCEYGFFLHNVQRGIHPPVSGYWNNDYFRESEGCPIRSDIWGLVAPCNPRLAAAMARLDGELDHSGFSVEAEMFCAAMTAACFTADTREEIIAAGLAVLPRDSEVAKVVDATRRIAAEFPDFDHAWQVVMRNFGDRDASKAVTNLAIVMMCWFLSRDDFSLAMRYCVNSGWDADCTAATLGAILGCWKGTSAIPATWRRQLGPALVCGIEVKHKHARLTDLGQETARIGVEMARCRNRNVKITDAPRVPVRRKPRRDFEFRVVYPGDPVLTAAGAAEATVWIRNTSGRRQVCIPTLTAPDHIAWSLQPDRVELAPGKTAAIQVAVRRRDPALPLPDKNLFTLHTGVPGQSFVFGLGGARQYLVYGPYWNMWDRAAHAECPYSNAVTRCNPHAAGCGPDSYNHYVDLDFEYLEEARLVREDIPEAVPRRLESGTDLIRGGAMGRWRGQSCYYLVRRFLLPEGANVVLMCGRSGRLKVWLDGELKGRFPEDHLWSPCDNDSIRLTGTGRPQRLVVKLVSPYEQGDLALYFLRDEEHGDTGISYLTDAMIDLIPECGGVM